MSDRLQEIRARMDAIKVGTVVGAIRMRHVIADSVWLLYAVRERHDHSDRLDEIAIRLAWWLQPSHRPEVGMEVTMAQIVETIGDARWLMAQMDGTDA